MQRHPLVYLAPIGRLMLALIFVMSGVGKFSTWNDTVGHMAGKPGVQAIEQRVSLTPAALLSVAVVLELVGGLSVMAGIYARVGALLLLLFLVPVTIIMHDFWTLEGAARMGDMIGFMKNLSIAGGIVLVLAHGAGPCSFDAWGKRPKKTSPPPAPPLG